MSWEHNKTKKEELVDGKVDMIIWERESNRPNNHHFYCLVLTTKCPDITQNVSLALLLMSNIIQKIIGEHFGNNTFETGSTDFPTQKIMVVQKVPTVRSSNPLECVSKHAKGI